MGVNLVIEINAHAQIINACLVHANMYMHYMFCQRALKPNSGLFFTKLKCISKASIMSRPVSLNRTILRLQYLTKTIRTTINKWPKVSLFPPLCLLLIKRNKLQIVKCEQPKLNRTNATSIKPCPTGTSFDWTEFWKVLSPDLLLLLVAAAVSL